MAWQRFGILEFDVFVWRVLIRAAVRAVAKGRLFRALAGAPGNGTSFGDFHFFRRPLRSLMRAVAKRLFGGASTGAPPINAGGRWKNDGRLDFRGCHSFFWLSKKCVCASVPCRRFFTARPEISRAKNGNSALVFGWVMVYKSARGKMRLRRRPATA